MNLPLLIRAYAQLTKMGLVMRFGSLEQIHSLVKNESVTPRANGRTVDVETICHSIDLACTLYLKSILCLQRSAATTILLRRYGWSAELVIGAQVLPFKSHAWVEVDGTVVNDKPYTPEIYVVLERC
jgi:Transglutaminase-like superfamily